MNEWKTRFNEQTLEVAKLQEQVRKLEYEKRLWGIYDRIAHREFNPSALHEESQEFVVALYEREHEEKKIADAKIVELEERMAKLETQLLSTGNHANVLYQRNLELSNDLSPIRAAMKRAICLIYVRYPDMYKAWIEDENAGEIRSEGDAVYQLLERALAESSQPSNPQRGFDKNDSELPARSF